MTKQECDEIGYLLKQLDDRSRKEKIKDGILRFFARNFPHKMYSSWCMPVWWCFFFGGIYDSGNGSGWRPNLYHTIRNKIRWRKLKRKEQKYWQKHFEKYGYETGTTTKVSYDGGKIYGDAEPYNNKFYLTNNKIIETINGDYKIVYHEGPLSCSVAGGMTLEITTKNGEKASLFLPPGYFLEKI